MVPFVLVYIGLRQTFECLHEQQVKSFQLNNYPSHNAFITIENTHFVAVYSPV